MDSCIGLKQKDFRGGGDSTGQDRDIYKRLESGGRHKDCLKGTGNPSEFQCDRIGTSGSLGSSREGVYPAPPKGQVII